MNCGYNDHPEFVSYVPLCRDCVVSKLPEFPFLQELLPQQDASRESVTDKVWQITTFVDDKE